MIINKYYKWYHSIIDNAKLENRKKGLIFYESHHIMPTSMGGTNSKDNRVLLTPQEHCTCHHLLTRFTTGSNKSKMNHAFWGMINAWGRKKNTIKITNKVYAKLKETIANQISINNTGKSHPHSIETKKKLSESKMGAKNPNFGKSPNKGVKRPGIGGVKKGSKWSDETHLSIAIQRSSESYKNTMQTLVYKNKTRNKKISDSQRGRVGTSLGKVWYNDGINEFYADAVPIGLIAGRLPGLNKNKLGLCWFNNGTINKQFKLGTELEGYSRGRISKK